MKYLFLTPMFILILLTTHVSAKPTSVILYPHGATVTEHTNIATDKNEVALLLPAVAFPESLTLSLKGQVDQKIIAIDYELMLPESDYFGELVEQIQQLKTTIVATDDKIASLALALKYWEKQQELPVKTLADTVKMGNIIQTESITLLQQTSKLQQQKQVLEFQLTEAEDQLHQKIGADKRNWKVIIILAKPTTAGLELTYTYRIKQAGWKSTYSLNALPDSGNIEWLWTANIQQQSGVDWHGVNLKISTAEPVFTLNPPVNYPWEIRARQIAYKRKGIQAMPTMAMAMPEQIMAMPVADAAPPQPTRTVGQLFDIYDLGTISVASGKELQVKVRAGNWPAEFTYLSRPLLTNQVFLQANLDLSKNFIPLPSGTASIQVDGVHVGIRNFSLHQKNDITMSFGSDPAIGVAVATDHTAGEEGLLAKKDTYNWKWNIKFSNHKNFPVKVQVEDSYPHAGHKDIVVTELFTPPLPTKNKDHSLRWDLTIPAQGEQQHEYGYKIKYPHDMSVFLGR